MLTDIVAVGLLTPADLERLGNGFNRYYSVTNDETFADLIAQLDKIPPVRGHPASKGDKFEEH